MSGGLIDVNVNLGQWPTRRVAGDEAGTLVERLGKHGVVEAWAGSFDGVFHEDLRGVNARLAEACRSSFRRKLPTGVRLVPFGEINPLAADWEAELARCADEHRMPGIRLHPNYHGYALDHPEFARLLNAAAERGLVVTLAVLLEDERMMHPLLRVPRVDLAPLTALVKQTPGARLVLLNAIAASSPGDALHALLNAGEVYVEIAMLEGVGGVEKLLAEAPLERVLFGSHAPNLYFESALLKLKESHLANFQLRAVSEENARRLIPTA